MHGPCGIANPSSPCMSDGRCKYRYPRPLQETTTMDDDGYPRYRRRDDGRRFDNGKGFVFNNQWVVPYNPYLSNRYDCHINVELASTVSAVKYLYKYVYKGNDRAAFVLHNEDQRLDEIKDYLDGRYVSPAEACSRLLEFNVAEHQPTVVHLHIHLEGENQVVFHPTMGATEAIQQARTSPLLAFFKFCAQNPEATHDLLYPDAPSRLTWDRKKEAWKVKGKRGQRCIGRVTWATPAMGQLFYLRMLLYHVPGPTSHQHLRTVNGHLYDSEKAACEALGLLESDTEFDTCLYEAAGFHTAHALRILFVAILQHSQPTNPAALWDRHKVALSEGCSYRLQQQRNITQPTAQQVEDLALHDLQRLAEQNGTTLMDLGLPNPTDRTLDGRGNRLLLEEQSYDRASLRSEYAKGWRSANRDQQKAITAVNAAVAEGTGGLFFLDGPGGTGKTYVEQLILAHTRGEGKVALAVASSGVASLLLSGGRTAHSRFKIPLEVHEESACCVGAQTALAALLRKTSLIIWDEAVMQHRHCFLAVDRMLRDVRSTDSWFGGVTVLFAGDLRQCLPVVPKGSRADTVGATLTQSSFWSHTTVLSLTINMQLGEHRDDRPRRAFAKWLLEIGAGLGRETGGMADVCRELALPEGSTQDDLINHVYSDISAVAEMTTTEASKYLSSRAVLAPHNLTVNEINAKVLHRMQGESRVSLSADRATLQDERPVALPEEFVNTITVAGFPTHRLELKNGTPVILLRNLAPAEGLCNGTRLIVTSVGTRVLSGQIMSGTRAGQSVLIPRIRLVSAPTTQLPFTLHHTQFPVRLAFAMSINKAQGQSLPHVGLDLTRAAFAHGQLYVGLSRATDPSAVRILLPADSQQRTANVVYEEVFTGIHTPLL